jgi:hypothetical protein
VPSTPVVRTVKPMIPGTKKSIYLTYDERTCWFSTPTICVEPVSCELKPFAMLLRTPLITGALVDD